MVRNYVKKTQIHLDPYFKGETLFYIFFHLTDCPSDPLSFDWPVVLPQFEVKMFSSLALKWITYIVTLRQIELKYLNL